MRRTIALILTLLLVLGVFSFVACNDTTPPAPDDDSTVVVEKKSLIQQRNEVYETEGKAKWYDYAGKEYSFGKLGMSTTFNDPQHRHYDWEDLVSYEMKFSDEQAKTTILGNAGFAVKNYWIDKGKTVETEIFSNVAITFAEFSEEGIAEVVAKKQKYYDDLVKILNMALESEGMTAEETEKALDYASAYDPQNLYGGETIKTLENEVLKVTQKFYVPTLINMWGVQGGGKTHMPYLLELNGGIKNPVESAVVISPYTFGIVLEKEIVVKETNQIFCIRTLLAYTSDYYEFISADNATKKTATIYAESLEYATPAMNVIQPILDEIVDDYLIEEYGVEL